MPHDIVQQPTHIQEEDTTENNGIKAHDMESSAVVFSIM